MGPFIEDLINRTQLYRAAQATIGFPTLTEVDINCANGGARGNLLGGRIQWKVLRKGTRRKVLLGGIRGLVSWKVVPA